MCGICDIKNEALKPNLYFSIEEFDAIARDLFLGSLNISSLNMGLYLKSAELMFNAFQDGYSKKISETEMWSDESERYFDFYTNIYAFSAAKQYQFVREAEAVKKDDFSIFKVDVKVIFDKYYLDYLDAEIDTCNATGESVENWDKLINWASGEEV